jgi:fibronectin type 3 domain-containing protein
MMKKTKVITTYVLALIMILSSLMAFPSSAYGLDNAVELYSFKTVGEYYLCAENGGGSTLVADRTEIGPWEKFQIIKLTNGYVALKSYEGYYLSASEDEEKLNVEKTEVGKRERFKIVELENNKVALKTYYNKYVCAEDGGGREVVANRTAIGEWESFELIKHKDENNDNKCVLTAEANDNGVKLSWTKPVNTKNLVGYYIYRGTTSGKQSDTPITDFYIKETSYTDKNVNPNTKYYYIVKPVYKEGILGSASNEVEVITKTSIVLSAKAVNDGIYLSWNKPKNSSEIKGYYIYRATSSGQQSNTPITDFYIKDTSYTDKNINPGTKYYYIVKPVYRDGSLGPASNEVDVLFKSNIVLSAKAVNDGIYLSWNKPQNSSEIKGYYIYRATSLGKQTSTPITDFPIEGTSYTDKNIDNNKTYYYILKAVYKKDNSLGEPSNEVSVKSSLGKTIVLKVGSKHMYVNGNKIEIDQGKGTEVVIVNGRTFLPIRALIENMGGRVEWNEKDKKVSLYLNDHVIQLWIGSKTAKVDGKIRETDVAPYISQTNRTMLPLRFIVENFDCEVEWDGTTKTVTIKTN